MDYNRIALFVRVVKAGGFTAAAHEAQLPKSSVSRSVALLEQELGVRLLQRTTRKVTLTEAGQAYFDAVNGSVAQLDDADAMAREHGNAPRGTVRITIPPDLGTLPEVLARFRKLYPAVRVEVSIASRFVDLIGEGFDLAIRAGKLEDSTLVARRIGSTEMALMASPAYLRKRGKPKTVADLAEHDWVLYRAVNGRAQITLSGPQGIQETVEVAASLQADDMSFCRKAAEEGHGIALLPVHNALQSVTDRSLELVLAEWSVTGASLYVVLPTSRFVPGRVALLRDFLVTELGKQLAASEERCKRQRRD